jgi:putative phosphoribosyl transferase
VSTLPPAGDGPCAEAWPLHVMRCAPPFARSRPRSADGGFAVIPFADRRDAGRRLAEILKELDQANPIVIALPRGGVPVAGEIARALDAPLEILAVRKIGAPGRPEFGIGAIAEDGTRVIDEEAIAVLGVRNGELEQIVSRERAELDRRVLAYREERPPPDFRDRTVVIVDDGAATGLTVTAAIRAVRRHKPRRIVLAVPVCSSEALAVLRDEADQVVCLRVPRRLRSVGNWYRDFAQVSDAEVIAELRRPAKAVA